MSDEKRKGLATHMARGKPAPARATIVTDECGCVWVVDSIGGRRIWTRCSTCSTHGDHKDKTKIRAAVAAYLEAKREGE